MVGFYDRKEISVFGKRFISHKSIKIIIIIAGGKELFSLDINIISINFYMF